MRLYLVFYLLKPVFHFFISPRVCRPKSLTARQPLIHMLCAFQENCRNMLFCNSYRPEADLMIFKVPGTCVFGPWNPQAKVVAPLRVWRKNTWVQASLNQLHQHPLFGGLGFHDSRVYGPSKVAAAWGLLPFHSLKLLQCMGTWQRQRPYAFKKKFFKKLYALKLF